MKSSTTQEVHAFLWSKRNSRDLVSTNQKVLAEEFGLGHITFHRLVKQLVDEGKLKVTAVGSRGLKTFKVFEPQPSFSIDEDELTPVHFVPYVETYVENDGEW